MSVPTAEMSPPRLELLVRHTGRIGPLAGSDEVVFSTTTVFVRLVTPGSGVFAAAMNALPKRASVSLCRFG
jgi:hypothetical protein